MPSIPFPSVVDNSMVSSFVSCERKFFNTYLRNLAPSVPSIHLHAGGAFAKGIEIVRKSFYVENRSPRESIERGTMALINFYGDYPASDSAVKTVERMAGALSAYFDTWPLESDLLIPAKLTDGSAAIEFSFTLPLEILHPTTGDPLLYYGRLDMLATRKDDLNKLWLVDEKTTSKLGDTWGDQFQLSSQPMGYAYGAKYFGYPVQGMIIRGVSILKNSYGTREVIVREDQWKIDRWWDNLHLNIEKMLYAWETDRWGYDFGHTCHMYSGCQFFDACNSPNEEAILLSDEFYTRIYDPINKPPIYESPADKFQLGGANPELDELIAQALK